MKVFFIFVNSDLFFEFIGQNIEKTVADLSLGNKRRNVINFKLSPSELIIHLFDIFLQLLSHLLTFLETAYLFLIFIQYLYMFLQFQRLLPVHFAMVL